MTGRNSLLGRKAKTMSQLVSHAVNCRLFNWTYARLDRWLLCQDEPSDISIFSQEIAHDNLRLLRIEQYMRENWTLIVWKIKISQFKATPPNQEFRADRTEGPYLLRISATFCSSRTSASVEETVVAHVLHKWFRRQHCGLGKENKFITLPYLQITPQRAINGDSEETRGPHPLLPKLLGEAPGWMCHLQLLPQTPPDLTPSGVTALFQTLSTTLVLSGSNFDTNPVVLLWLLLRRLQQQCDQND